jgi:hypothetical protein
MGRRRALWTALGAALPLLALPGAAFALDPAPVAITVAAAPLELQYPAQSESVYSVRLATGANAERLELVIGGQGWGESAVSGFALAPDLSRLTVAGAGRIAATIHGDPVSPPPGTCMRGPQPASRIGIYELDLPAASTTTVSFPAAIEGPRWPFTSYRPSIEAISDIEGGYVTYGVQVPAPHVTGPTGVEIMLGTNVALPPAISGPGFAVAAGRRVRITGTTNPRIAYQVISLAARFETATSEGRARFLTPVRTDGEGEFVSRPFRFHRRGGAYKIIASYRSQRPGLVDDTSCDLALQVQ